MVNWNLLLDGVVERREREREKKEALFIRSVEHSFNLFNKDVF